MTATKAYMYVATDTLIVCVLFRIFTSLEVSGQLPTLPPPRLGLESTFGLGEGVGDVGMSLDTNLQWSKLSA